MPSSSLTFMTLVLSISFILLSSFTYGNDLEKVTKKNSKKVSVGAFVDGSSRAGREEKVAMEMAIQDFCDQSFSQVCPNLLLQGPPQDPIQTAVLANTIVKNHRARAILLGSKSWKNALIVAELVNKSKIPILSLSNDQLIHQGYLPFLVNAARSQHFEMKAVAAILRSWEWKKVNLIYEQNGNSIDTSFIPNLVEAVQEIGSEITSFLPIKPFTHKIRERLESLKNKQSRVFIVHTYSISLAIRIFEEAKSLEMLEEGSVWITTTSVTNQIDALDSTQISFMQGAIGVKSHFLKPGTKYEAFRSRFKVMYKLQYPDETILNPGLFAAQTYDATWAVSLALEEHESNGKQLLECIIESNFSGLSGPFRFSPNSTLPPENIFEIVNMVGKSFTELGFWSEGLGFSTTIGSDTKYNASMLSLGQVLWPGRPWTVPRGWQVPHSSKPLRIGVPEYTTFGDFVTLKHDPEGQTIVGGFSIDVFKRVVDVLPYHLPYEFVSLHGSYDSMVQQVHLQVIDALVADTAIVANRCNYVEFSHPYAESGVQMLIRFEAKKLDKAWLFTTPFTPGLWLATIGMCIGTGFIIWIIERDTFEDFREATNWLDKAGISLSLAFFSLFSQHGEKYTRIWARVAQIVWLFVALVVTSSFTASLTSILTAQQLKPTLIDVETLKSSGAKVGCDGNSFVVKYLEQALGFSPDNIVKFYSGDDYPEALQNGKIKAAFLEVPYVKVFLSKYCNNFTTSGSPFQVGGFGYAFPRGSPYLPDISEAILKITESGALLGLEKSMLSSSTNECLSSSSSSDSNEHSGRLDLDSFEVLFWVTAGTSGFALLFNGIQRRMQPSESPQRPEQEPAGNQG